ncbi:hypothetical protein [Allokutzneria albata]|nr:hypothetical protein [Allokutzneria albata]
MRKTTRAFPGMATALITMLTVAMPATAGNTASVVGRAEIDTHDPVSTFEFTVHARAGRGVVWIAHHDDEQIGWLVARVDCVRVTGGIGVVTAIVSDAQDFSGATPGDPISLTVRDDRAGDRLGFASREQVRRCHGLEPTHGITRGDLRVRH